MCGRFFVDAKNREIDRLIEALSPDSPPFKVGEIFPTNNSLVLNLIENNKKTQVMSWGFPRWNGKGVIFNVRSESALDKPMFRNALLRQPLVIPSNGFYEWKSGENGKEKYFFKVDDPLLYMAGFWKEAADAEGNIKPYFTILTTAANPSMRAYHQRMPVLLRKEEILPWLTSESTKEILNREPFAVRAYNV